MNTLRSILAPELVLIGVAFILFLMGCVRSVRVRRATAWVALFALIGAFATQVRVVPEGVILNPNFPYLRLDPFASFFIALSCLIAIMLLLLAWPTNPEQTGNSALRFGQDAGEFFGLFLLSIAGLFFVAISNDLIILFLALELVSLPTYVMVSMSRANPVAQEAGVKYFFLGAMSVAIMLFGFSYLYGTTGSVNFQEIATTLRRGLSSDQAPALTAWQDLAILLLIISFTYKMAAFPLQFYAGDVYEGAGTPVTAFLAFVPKTAGFIALVRILSLVGGEQFALPLWLTKFLAITAALTMCIGNVLGLLQNNVKRVLAYSSIAHSGYMLVAVAALPALAHVIDGPAGALRGLLFYLIAYGIMNTGAFGVLMMLPSRTGSGSAETFDEIAGQGRRHVWLGLAMAIACFSLIGIPLTVGFIGKVLLILPALRGGLTWLVIVLIINAAISAAYYLRITGSMFLRPGTPLTAEGAEQTLPVRQRAVAAGVLISAVATLVFGLVPPAVSALMNYAESVGAPASIRPVEGAGPVEAAVSQAVTPPAPAAPGM